MRNETWKTFQLRLVDVINSKGQLCLPNVKEITDPQEALNLIKRTSDKLSKAVEMPYQFKVQKFDPPKKAEYPFMGEQTSENTWYPKIFLNSVGMAGVFDGSGIFLCTPSGRGGSGARAFSFAMCEHDWDESGANHMRGWHPKICKKCGVDASIDSGD